jgi:hypothetical protein
MRFGPTMKRTLPYGSGYLSWGMVGAIFIR